MFRLIALLLLLPSAALGQTITLPAETVATGKLVLIQPVFSPADKVLDVKYAVLGLKEKPRFYSLPSVKEAILVERPGEGDEITIVVAATFEGGKLANQAVTNIKGSGQPGTTPTTPTTPTVPTNPPSAANIPATGLAVIMVVDGGNVPADINQLAKGENAITQFLAKRQGLWYVRNITDSLITGTEKTTSLLPFVQGKQLPVLLVLNLKATDPSKRVVLSESFTPLNDASQTAQAIIQRITPK